jgi:hypothetical protein
MDEPNAVELHPLLLLRPPAAAWHRCRAKPGVVGGGRPSSLARGGLRLLQRAALDGVLPAAEKGPGAEAPGIYGEDGGCSGCTGSAVT